MSLQCQSTSCFREATIAAKVWDIEDGWVSLLLCEKCYEIRKRILPKESDPIVQRFRGIVSYDEYGIPHLGEIDVKMAKQCSGEWYKLVLQEKEKVVF